MTSFRETPPTQVTFREDPGQHPLFTAIMQAFGQALENRSKLSPDLFAVEGFSGRRFRMFLNNLFAALDDRRYLEIGVFKGGSFVPAIYGNKMSATGVDNWSWPNADMHLFRKYLMSFSGEAEISVINSDFRQVDWAGIGKFNVMFYDGSHDEADQFDGMRLPAAAMDDCYIVIVDDWNWPHVRRGTFDGLRDAGSEIRGSIELFTSLTGELPAQKFRGITSDWHNGMFAALVSKAGQPVQET